MKTMESNQIDHELLQQIAKGHSHAFSELLQRHQSRVFGTCFYLMGDRGLAEDLSQETWLRVVKAAGDYSPAAPAGAWILRIARNACFNELRSRKRWAELTPEVEMGVVDEVTPESLFVEFENENQLQSALLTLSPQQKVALMLVIQEEKSHAEVAQELQCSVGAVKGLLFRARETLKKRLEEK